MTSVPANSLAPPRPAPPRVNYRGFIVAGGLAFLLLFGGAGTWMAIAEVSGAVVASGAVIVRGKPRLVQHLEGGIVREILARNGDRVEKGATLVRLDDTLLLANLEIYRNRIGEAIARKARLEAERDGLDHIQWDESADEVYSLKDYEQHRTGQQSLFDARRSTLDGEVAQLQERIEQLGNQRDGVQGVMDAKNQQVGMIDEELTGVRQLVADGTTPKVRLLQLERSRAELAGQISEHAAELARIQNSIGETEIAILQARRQFLEGVLSELREVTTEVNDLSQQVVATTEQLKRVELVSPVSGYIHEANVYTVGGVVAPGATVMEVVPTDDGIEIEVNVDPQSVDQLHLGQQSVVRFPAFNQRTTPELFGQVSVISPSSVVDERTGIAFYRVSVAVTADEIERLGDNPLVPGMPAEAFIQTHQRTILSYLVKPFSDQIARAFRED